MPSRSRPAAEASPPWIAYVGPIVFPWGQAASRRVYGVARSLMETGHNVVVASGESGPPDVTPVETDSVAASLAHIGLDELPRDGDDRIEKVRKVVLGWGGRTVAWLDSQPRKPSHVVLYGGGAQYMYRLKKWCRQHRVRLIVDVVEWYDPKQFTGGVLGPLHVSAKLALRHQYPRADGIIAISTLLESYYRDRGRRTVRIPPTLDVKSVESGTGSAPGGKLRLVYAGTPGKKDLLANIVTGAAMADPDGSRLELAVIGPAAAEVATLLGRAELPPAVHVLGKMPQHEVGAVLARSDFSVLLRERMRFADAGFPTKFVESLSRGTPAIANLTGDLKFHLTDGVEGIVCPDHSAAGFAEAVRRALTLAPERRREMRHHAREQAVRSFDYRQYVKPLRQFLGA